LENEGKIEKFVDTYDSPKLKQEVIKNLNRCMTNSEVDTAIKNLPTKKSPGPEFTAKFYQTFKEELALMLLKLFHKVQKE
jgi:hypothetical protein